MNNNDDYALLTDLYQITMAQGYWACGKLEEEGCFHIFFREPPFKGGYAIASGMDHIAEVVENFSFSDESVEYLASIDAPGGGSYSILIFLSICARSSLLSRSTPYVKARWCSRMIPSFA